MAILMDAIVSFRSGALIQSLARIAFSLASNSSKPTSCTESPGHSAVSFAAAARDRTFVVIYDVRIGRNRDRASTDIGRRSVAGRSRGGQDRRYRYGCAQPV